MEKGAAIDVEQLRVVRGGTLALDGVSLQVSAGRVTGLLGPSGSGKSTLIRAVVGVQRITSGGVTVFGEAAGSASLRARIGYGPLQRSRLLGMVGRAGIRERPEHTGPGEGSVADAMSEPPRLTIVYEDADDGDGWVVARIPQVRGAISQETTRRGGARKRDRRAPRAARGPVRGPSCQTAPTATRSS